MTAAWLGWLLLGVFLAATSRPAGTAVFAVAGVPWAVGAIVLATSLGPPACQRLVEGLSGAAGRVAAVLILAAVFSVHVAMGPFGALLAVAWSASPLLVVAATGTEARVRDLLVGGALAAGVTVVLIATAELILSQPSISDRLGTPAARVRWEAKYDSLWARNVLGLRSPHERVARQPGVQRAVTLGDSFTWGDKIASADSVWPQQLEDALNAQHAGTWEVFNLGQRGWTAANEAEALARLGWQLEPDVVVWQFFVNDTYASTEHFGRDGEQWRRLLPARFRGFAAGNSVLLYLLERILNLERGDVTATYGHLFRRDSPGWRQFESAVSAVADSASKHGVPVIFVLWPAFVPGTWTPADYPLRELYAQAGAAADSSGLHVLDLTPTFAAAGGDWRRWWALPWDSHPNAEGHAVAAEAIRRFLMDSIIARKHAS